MTYAHLFNARRQRGAVELYLTATPSLAGAQVHSTYPDKRSAREAVKALGAKPWNF
jgi:hypothetical protein